MGLGAGNQKGCEGHCLSLGIVLDMQDYQLVRIIQRVDFMAVLFGEAPFMGREPLGLPISIRVHTCRPGPPSRPPALEFWLPSQTKKFRQPCSVSEAWEAVAGAVAISWDSLESTERSWSVAPIQAPGTAQKTQTSSAYFSGSPCYVWGLWIACSRDLAVHLQTIQPAAEPTDLQISNYNGIFNQFSIKGVSCCVNREVKARKFADAMWSRNCTPCFGSGSICNGLFQFEHGPRPFVGRVLEVQG
eukprot:1159858-Pelagomonas_calceolata.AAC.9